MNWTKSQQDAIDIKNRTLLVSAAAGSGKTAVLTARIIKRLTDAENPADISRMLIVTFTKAAAGELRSRISDALKSALRENPENKALKRQYNALNSAKICTIHSFCLDVIRRNFSSLGLSPRIRVADESESKVLCTSLMDAVINQYYDQDAENSDIEDFAAFSDLFVTDRDDSLSDILLKIYKKLQTYPEGIDFLKNASALGGDFMESAWGIEIKSLISRMCEHYLAVYNDACEFFADGDVFEKNYLPSFISDRNFLVKLRSVLDSPYDNIREYLSSYTKLDLGHGVKKVLQNGQVLFFKGVREKLIKDIKSIREKYFSFDHDRIVDFSIINARLNADTASILRTFDKALTDEKKKRGIIDFSDLERLCYSLLIEDGKRTAIAEEIAQSIDEIYIDEYQDTNELQDGIFAAISNPRNRFMVGDIKQSIYGFRGALPNIFSSYRDRFPVYDGSESDSSTVFLSDNFRCDKPVIEYSNLIFDKLFTNTSSNLTYYPSDRLKFSKVVDKEDFHRVETVIVEEGDGDDEYDSEADYVVSRINELLDVGYRPSDIVILLASPSSDAERFENALKDINIPFYSDVKRSFFENAEILLMLCLLNCIDNPTRDIYFAGALKSPIYNFSLNELVEIRKERDNCSLYEAFIAYSERTESPKCKYFLEKLDSYRKFSRAQAVDKLIWHIYRDTSLLSLVYDNTESGKSRLRRANLMLLYDYARKFESSSFKGLNNFIAYLNDIISENDKFEDAKTSSESENVVRIMSIHQSKGLEFPVCFLCGCNKGFNYIDSRNDIVFTRKLGLSTRIRDESGFIRYDTPIRAAVSLEITRNTIDEQMRVLYVALTRARERLIVTARAKDASKFLEEIRLSSSYISNYSLSQNPSYIKWILSALYTSEYDDCCIIKTADNDFSDDDQKSDACEIPDEEDPASYHQLREEIERRFRFKYKYSDSVDIPAKLSVSHLYPTILDDEEVVESDVLTHMKERPSFLDRSQCKESASEKGTATHVFMQFCDFKNTELNGAKEELSRLIVGKFIAPHYADLVYLDHVDAFFKSSIYKRVKDAQRIHRETRFNISLPAADFTEDKHKKELLKDESILVQGVMDLIFLDQNDKFVLLDYKTDKIPYQIRNDLGAVKDFLSERHSLQLSYYKTACERLFMRKVDEVYVYAFDIDKEIRLC